MRLTLRTMLAYLDGVLETDDAQTLKQKIDDSEFANGLVQRIGTVTRNLRLDAPRLDGRGIGLDPNSVAEYLDNTLSSERVPEFEKVCLESDVHLAEVASCHQILTLVLDGPAAVEPGVRERMYRLGMQRLAGARGGDPVRESPRETAGTEGAVHSGPAVAEPVSRPAAVSGTAPTTRRSPWALVTTLALGFLLTLVALRAMGPLDASHPVYQLFLGSPRLAERDALPVPPEAPESGEAGEPHAQPAEPASANEPEDPSRPRERAEAGDGETPPESAGAAAVSEPAVEETGPAATAPDAPLRVEPRPPETVKVEPPEGVDAEGAAPVTPPAGTPPAGTPPAGTPPAGTPERVPAAPSRAVVGRYISEAQVLGRLDPATGTWRRLQQDDLLAAPDELQAFPSYRPQVLLVRGVKWTFTSAARLALAADEQGEPLVRFAYGRALANTDGTAGLSMRLHLGGREGQAAFLDANSELAVEVLPYLSPGSDPLQVPPPLWVMVYATQGRIAWSEGDVPPRIMQPGEVRVSVDGSPARTYAAVLPEWLDFKQQSGIDIRAARDLELLVPRDRPLELSLQEKAEHRQTEVRALAIRCLACVDVFEPAVDAFNQELQHSYWAQHLDALHAALGRGPETAERLRLAWEKKRGEEARLLYRLVVGYSPQQLLDGGAAELVALLEHRSMDVRVLALENLRRITQVTKLYRPEKSPDQQKRQLREWKVMLDAGQIAYRSVPTPLPMPLDPGPGPENRTSFRAEPAPRR